MLEQYLQFVVPLAIGGITVPITDLLKRATAKIGQLPSWLKPLVAGTVAFALTHAGVHLDVALPTDLSLFTEGDVQSLASAAVALALHAGKKRAKGV